ncbi:MAG: hypothetical protein DI527_16485 [Chelatococcus sp.]|nr:MAG: hypothetical protein DI527_16485 [Chelatococcus sp.]
MQIELTADQVSALMSKLPPDATGPNNGFRWDDGVLTVPPVREAAVLTITAVTGWDAAPDPLAVLKELLKQGIDQQAERERLKYITAGAGQAMTYQQKAAEALRLADDPEPDPAAYPMLSAEVGVTATDLSGVGAIVRAAHAQWLAMGAAIETARLSGKQAIDLAATAEAARAVVVIWPQAEEN